MSLVLDASLTLAWLLPDEMPPAGSESLGEMLVDGAVVPAHWHLEVGIGLLMAERRKRLLVGGAGILARELTGLSIETHAQTGDKARSETLHLAHEHALTLYDAAYLELARRLDLSFATADRALIAAAPAAGVRLAFAS